MKKLSLGAIAAVSLILAAMRVNSFDLKGKDCESRNLSAEQAERCLEQQKNIDNISDPFKNFQKLTYPVMGFAMQLSPGTAESVAYTMESQDGKEILIKKRCYHTHGCNNLGNPIVDLIKSDQVIKWNVSMASSIDNASEQLRSVSVAAFLCPICAPFSAAINSKTFETYRFAIEYIDNLGERVTLVGFYHSRGPMPSIMYAFLPQTTQLEMGEEREFSTQKKYYLNGLQRLEAKVRNDMDKLFETKPKKPWCKVRVVGQYPLLEKRLAQNKSKLLALKKYLSINKNLRLEGDFQEDKWIDYLAEKGLTEWSVANPAASKKLQSCQ